MVATSPIHTPDTKPTPIEAAQAKAKTAAREGRLSDGLPVRFDIPTDAQFEKEKSEYLNALDIRYIARKVIEETGHDLSHVNLADVDFAWKFKGGKDKGQPKRGDVVKQTDIAKFHGGMTWFVWLAADHCRSLVDSEVSTRALVYSMLARIGFAYDDKTGVVTPKINPPDASFFFGELRHYGNWRLELTLAANEFQQVRMPGV